MSISANKAMIVADVWTLLRDLIQPEDVPAAADNIVSLMIDYDINLDDIAHHMRNDHDIMRSVAYYRDDGDEDEDENFDSDDGWN